MRGLVGNIADIENDVVSVRIHFGYVHMSVVGADVGVYDASGARALAAILNAAADRCGDD